MYNLLARGVEQEYAPMCREFGVSTVVYNPLAGGLLTGKQQRERPEPGLPLRQPADGRLYRGRYWHPAFFDAVDELRGAAAQAGRSLVSVALNWLLHHTATDCVILGASKLEQLGAEPRGDGGRSAAGRGAGGVRRRCGKDLRGVTPKYNR